MIADRNPLLKIKIYTIEYEQNECETRNKQTNKIISSHLSTFGFNKILHNDCVTPNEVSSNPMR